ncbi:hypothetical protein [Pantoea dispersa]|uniref:hypothetical protein n=1 Tax=Pantoea dispersa TaxID=59814 RepID=UPI00223B19F6|nr:hypothetical protein [Pantoea dispersa]
MAHRLVFEVAEVMGCAGNVREDKHSQSAGFALSETSSEFVLFLAGLFSSLPNRQFYMFMFCLNFFGTESPETVKHVLQMLRSGNTLWPCEAEFEGSLHWNICVPDATDIFWVLNEIDRVTDGEVFR